jgi:hypothetical protein
MSSPAAWGGVNTVPCGLSCREETGFSLLWQSAWWLSQQVTLS